VPFSGHTEFDLRTLPAMTAAYDAVVARLNIKSNDPITSRLAAKIVALVKAGERDQQAHRASVGGSEVTTCVMSGSSTADCATSMLHGLHLKLCRSGKPSRGVVRVCRIC
jgi:hypothetical protein